MSSIIDILNTLAQTSSTTAKRDIIAEHQDNPLWRDVLFLAYTPTIAFHITPPKDAIMSLSDGTCLEAALELLVDQLASRQVTGNAARDLLDRIAVDMRPDDQDVFFRVIGRDLRCGINVGLINKAIPDLVPTFDFMLAETDSSSIVWPAYSQVKADGMRASIHQSQDGRVSIITRNGKTVDVLGALDHAVRSVVRRGETWDGELVCYEDGRPLPRKVSNGILNKALNGTISSIEADRCCFDAWDIVDETSTVPYKDRFSTIQARLSLADQSKIVAIDSVQVDTYEDALRHFKALRREGKEGTIVKNIDGKWIPRRSKDQCKFKAEIEGEFRVTGYALGTGKNSARIGNLFIESQCGKVKAEVGIFKGFADSVRDSWMDDLPPVVTVLYNERITSKGRETQSLFLPRVTAARWDKDVANTLEELIQIEQAILSDDNLPGDGDETVPS